MMAAISPPCCLLTHTKLPTGLPCRLLFTTWNGKSSVRSQTHRLNGTDQLFDLTKDPDQTRPINSDESALTESLQKAVRAWKAEMPGLRGPQSSKNQAVDPRPIPVGYPAFPITHLPARDGEPHGGIRRSSSAPDSSCSVNWAPSGLSRPGHVLLKFRQILGNNRWRVVRNSSLVIAATHRFPRYDTYLTGAAGVASRGQLSDSVHT